MKKTVKESLSQIRQTTKTANLVWKFVFAFEVILIIVIGISASNISTPNYETICLCTLIVSGIFYILIKIFFFTFNQQISENPVDELEARCDLEQVKNRLIRQDSINKTISQSVHMLNNGTCNLYDDGYTEIMANNICEQNLKDGLIDVLSPLMRNIPIIFNTNNLKYTLGIFIENFYHIDGNKQLIKNDHIVILRDDCEIGNNIPAQLYSQQTAKGVSLDIRSVICKSFNNNQYVEESIIIENKKLSMLSSIIPCVCSGQSQDGVLFVIYEPIESELYDIESTLDIFNRIIANWLSLFEQCVFNKADVYRALEMKTVNAEPLTSGLL